MKTVTFCGHGNLSGEPVKRIKEIMFWEIEKLILSGAAKTLEHAKKKKKLIINIAGLV